MTSRCSAAFQLEHPVLASMSCLRWEERRSWFATLEEMNRAKEELRNNCEATVCEKGLPRQPPKSEAPKSTISPRAFVVNNVWPIGTLLMPDGDRQLDDVGAK